MSDLKIYMVEFDIQLPDDEMFMKLIPEQRKKINDFFHKGYLMSYSLNENRTKLWGVFRVSNESELIQLLDQLPLTSYMDYNYEQLMFHNSLHMIPSISLN